jgi:hypothetical protein
VLHCELQLAELLVDFCLGESPMPELLKCGTTFFAATVSDEPTRGFWEEPDASCHDCWDDIEEAKRDTPGAIVVQVARAVADGVNDDTTND